MKTTWGEIRPSKTSYGMFRIRRISEQITTPTDATAALARMLAEARADEREKAAKACDKRAWPDGYATHPTNHGAEASAKFHEATDCAAAIRAMKGEGA